jgi:hypothetical protein
MSKDYFNTLPSGYIEYVNKIMRNLVVGSYKGPEWSDDWDIRLDDLNGNPIFTINGENDYPMYRVNFNPSAFLFNMVPMGGEGEQLEFLVQVYDKYNVERLIYDFFKQKNQNIDILGKEKGFGEWTPFRL